MAEEKSPERRELRASHEDRDGVAERLRVAAGDGRLTLEELDERLGRALTARTVAELAVLVTDLPAAGGAARPAKDLMRIEVSSGTTRRDGRWVVPRAMDVTVASGHVKLDLTEAVISAPTLEITAEVHSGSLVIVTRPGIEVDADDVSVDSGHVRVLRPRPADEAGQAYASAPTVLRVTVSGSVRSGVIKARPPRQGRRGPLAWLLRRPRPAPRG